MGVSVSVTPQPCFDPVGKGASVPLDRRLCWPQNRSGYRNVITNLFSLSHLCRNAYRENGRTWPKRLMPRVMICHLYPYLWTAAWSQRQSCLLVRALRFSRRCCIFLCIEAIRISETSVSFYMTTRIHSPTGYNRHLRYHIGCECHVVTAFRILFSINISSVNVDLAITVTGSWDTLLWALPRYYNASGNVSYTRLTR
jgi:hypothetical protein